VIPDDELEMITRRASARRDAAPRRTNDDIWRAVRGARRRPRLGRTAIAAGALAAGLLLVWGGIAIGTHLERRREADATNREAAQLIESHLRQSAAVIGAFRSAVASGVPNPDLGSWARHLEAVTRQLQATQASHDSTLDALLGDLDYAMAQIAAYADAGSNSAAESDLIESSVEDHQLVARLQAASARAARLADTHAEFAP